MQTDPPAGVSASPIADNVMTWYGAPPLSNTPLARKDPTMVLSFATMTYWLQISESFTSVVR